MFCNEQERTTASLFKWSVVPGTKYRVIQLKCREIFALFASVICTLLSEDARDKDFLRKV